MNVDAFGHALREGDLVLVAADAMHNDPIFSHRVCILDRITVDGVFGDLVSTDGNSVHVQDVPLARMVHLDYNHAKVLGRAYGITASDY